MDEAFDPELEMEAAGGGGGLTAIVIAAAALVGLGGLGGLYYAGALDRLFGTGPFAVTTEGVDDMPGTSRPGGAAPAPAAATAQAPAAAPAEGAAPAETAAAAPAAAARWIDGRWCAREEGITLTFTPGSYGILVEGDAYAGARGYSINGDMAFIAGPMGEDGVSTFLANLQQDGDSRMIATDENGGSRRMFERC